MVSEVDTYSLTVNPNLQAYPDILIISIKKVQPRHGLLCTHDHVPRYHHIRLCSAAN